MPKRLLAVLIILFGMGWGAYSQCPNAITNGNFEGGNFNDWYTYDDISIGNPDNDVITGNAISGNYSALIGSYLVSNFPWNKDTYMGRVISVPATGGILSFSYRCDTAGYTSPSSQIVTITTPITAASVVTDTVFHSVWGSGRGTVTFNLAKYAGQDIRLKFEVIRRPDAQPENASHYTSVSLTVDDIRINTLTSLQIFEECQLGFSHAAGNHVYTTFGTFLDTVNVGGCDSVISTFISKKFERATRQILFCREDTIRVQVGTHTYSTEGTFLDTISYASLNRCDSLLTTKIAYRRVPLFKQAFAGCDSYSVVVNHITHRSTSPGVYNYIDTVLGGSVNGCDSIVHTEVTINRTPSPAQQLPNLVVCDGDSVGRISFTVGDTTTFGKWHGTTANIGLRKMGVDYIPKFLAVNNGTTPIIDTISVVVKGRGYAWIPSGHWLYKFDISTKKVVDTATMPGSQMITNIAYDHKGAVFYATSTSSDYYFGSLRYFYEVSASTGELLRTFEVNPEVSSGPNLIGSMVVSPDDRFLYISAASHGFTWQFEKIELATGEITIYNHEANNVNEARTGQMCFNPDFSKMYVGTQSQGIREYNMPAFTLNRTLNAVSSCLSLVCSPDGKRLFTAIGTVDVYARINVIDIAADTIITRFTNPSITGPSNTFGGFGYTPDSSGFIFTHSSGQTPLDQDYSRFFLHDFDTYAPLARLGGNYGYVHDWYIYHGNPKFFFHNAFITPDGREVVIHEPMQFNFFCGVMWRPVYSTAQFTNVTVPLNRDSSNFTGSFGNLVDAGHCESQVMRFTITVKPTARYTLQRTICSGDSLRVANKYYSVTGTYIDTLHGVSVYGCDSIITTKLTVRPYATSYQAVQFCGNGSLTVGNVVHNTTGYYNDTLRGAAATGCDSIVVTNLIINPVAAAPNVAVSNQLACAGNTVNATILNNISGNSIVWNGSTTTIGLSASGLDSVPSFTAVNNSSVPVIDTISVAVSASGFAYVSNPNYAQVSVINRQTNSVVSTISGLNGAAGIATNLNGSRVYVAGQNVNNLSVINTATNAVMATVNVGTQPFYVAVNPSGNRVYTSNSGSNTVSVIDTVTNTVVTSVAVGTNPRGIAVHPAGKKVYVANAGSNTVSVINASLNTVSKSIAVGNSPNSMAVNLSGSRVYVSNLTSGNISVIDATVDTLMGNITLTSNGALRGIAVTPDGTKVYVADFLNNRVYVINTATNATVATITVGNRPTGVSVCADGSKVYVTNTLSGSVSVISTASNTIIASVTGMPGPDCSGVFTTGSGCTSMPVKYTITVKPRARFSQQLSLCAGSAVTVGTKIHNTTGTYIDTLLNAAVTGCDSIVTTQLTIRNAVTSTVSASICQGGSYAGHTAAGTYTDHYSNIYGCDSARTLTLTVLPNRTATVTTSICQGSNYAGHTASGTYVDHFTAANGCDSARTLNLTVLPNRTATITTSICQGSSYAGHTASGTYIDHYTAANGCDSARTLNLTVLPNRTATVTTSICQGGSYAGHSTAGTYVDHYTAANGCDSTRTLNLTVLPNVLAAINRTICQGNSYAGYTTSGTYVDHFTAVNGCDSTRTLNLTVLPNRTATVTTSICQGSNYAGHAVSGTYTDHYTAVNGCDSARTLNLTVLPNAVTSLTRSICQGSSFMGHTTSGTFVDHFTAANGCDSAVTLQLTVKQPTTGVAVHNACDSFVWINGQTYFNSTNTPTFTLTGSNGCDSVVKLQLTIGHPSSATDVQHACGHYTWIDGLTYTTSTSSPVFTLPNSTGCDSVVHLQLTIDTPTAFSFNDTICGGESYFFHGEALVATGVFHDTLVNGHGCDSVIELHLMVNQLNTQVNVTGANCSVAETDATYQWITCDDKTWIAGATGPTFAATVNGHYACVIIKNNCADTTACVAVDVLAISRTEDEGFKMYPNPTSRWVVVEWNAGDNARLEITDALGRLAGIHRLPATVNTIDVGYLPEGVYQGTLYRGATKLGTYKLVRQ
ncbi:MAG: YncE family protein [Chitinophagales bacterium]